jgi:serine/threonine protein kinase
MVNSPPRESLEYGQLKDDRTKIGSGGQGVVYRVNVSSHKLPEQIAVKEPAVGSDTIGIDDMEALQDEADTWETVDRREREKTRWKDSEHIVGVIDVGDEKLPWIAMEYMDGGGLDSRLDKSPNGGPMYTALWFGECICRGVEVAHNYGIAHLDLKPSNILFSKTPEDVWDVPKIADWGLSRVLTEQTETIEELSVLYAAPEQFNQEKFGDPDTLTDVYQVGALVYAMLTGDPPYTGEQASVMHDIVIGDDPTPPSEIRDDLPAAIDEVVLKALEKDKTDRYRNITDFEKALNEIRTGAPSSTEVPQSANSADDSGSNDEELVNIDDITTDSQQTTEIPDYTEPKGTLDVDSIERDSQATTTDLKDESTLFQNLIGSKSSEFNIIAAVTVFSLAFFTTILSLTNGFSNIMLQLTTAISPSLVGGTVAGWVNLNYSAPIFISIGSHLSLVTASIITGVFSATFSQTSFLLAIILILTLILFFITKKARMFVD